MKNIWISGASSGIGRALALKFAKEGWQVAASARRENLLNEVSELDKNISSFPLDVTDKEKCKDIFEQIKNKYQNVDICFFSTGTWDPKKEKDIDIEQIEKTMKVNFFGTLNCIKSVEEYFKNKKKGHISIVSSIAGYRGLPNSTGYGASKAAMIRLSKSVAIQFAKLQIRSNTIIPGPIETPMQDRWKKNPTSKKNLKKLIPLQKIGKPDDIANLVMFLLSDESNYINGSEIIE